MVTVLCAEAVQDDFLFICDEIAIKISKVKEIRLGNDVRAAVTQYESSRDIETIREDRLLVGDAVAIHILEDKQFVTWLFDRSRQSSRNPTPR